MLLVDIFLYSRNMLFFVLPYSQSIPSDVNIKQIYTLFNLTLLCVYFKTSQPEERLTVFKFPEGWHIRNIPEGASLDCATDPLNWIIKNSLKNGHGTALF